LNQVRLVSRSVLLSLKIEQSLTFITELHHFLRQVFIKNLSTLPNTYIMKQKE